MENTECDVSRKQLIKDAVKNGLIKLSEEFRDNVIILLKDNNMTYQEPQYTLKGCCPYGGIIKPYSIDQALGILEDVCDDEYGKASLDGNLRFIEDMKKEIQNYKVSYESPAARILQHQMEIERLIEKYGVTDEQIKEVKETRYGKKSNNDNRSARK